MKTDQLILYRNMAYEDLLMEMNGALDSDGKKEDVWSLANRLIELAAKYGLEGNLWHCFLALCIANHENAYSISCEIRDAAENRAPPLSPLPGQWRSPAPQPDKENYICHNIKYN